MQRIILLLAVLYIFQISANAQDKNSIAGSVADSTSKHALEYATITLSDAKTNKVLNGGTTDSVGYFKLNDIEAGTYNISFESIGYAKKITHNITIKESHIPNNMGTIFLRKSANTLADVVVSSQVPQIENKIDKIVFNTANDVTSQGGVATDVLKKVPQVSVDADGNVELAGSSGIRFLIDGKPSTAFGSNIADVLQSIPASEIKSVEVITNPGARYDAQGMGGIINIILKKSRVNGINGNISLNAGTRLENGSFNLTVRHNNFGLNAFISGNTRLAAKTPTTSNRTTTDSIDKEIQLFNQQSTPRTNHYGLQSGLGFDWTFNKYNNFSGNVNYNRYGSGGNGLVNQEEATTSFNSDTVFSDILSTNNYKNNSLFHSTDADINYKRTFAKQDQSLEIDVSTSLGRNNSTNNNFQTLLPQDSVYYGINNSNFGKEDETEIEIDYAQPFSDKINFGAGADFTFNNIKSTSNVFALDPSNKLYAYDSTVSNYLSYKQSVYAAYAELSFPVGNLFDAKIGSRYERTEINAYYSDAAQQLKTPGYNTFVPSIYFLKKLNNNQAVKISYSRRINRPDYDDLNPFINTSDPKNISAGNPYLKPEVGNRFELSYNRDYGNKGSFMISAFYRTSNNDIQPYTAFYPTLTVGDSTYTNVSVSTRENIGLEQNAGVSFYGSLHPTEKFNIRTNLSFYRRHIINGIDLGRNPTSFNYHFNVNLSYEFDKSFSTEFFGSFRSPRNELQGKYPSFTSYTIAARKQFWNKKASIAITATNFLNTYLKLPTVLYGTNFVTNNERNIPFRSIGINLTWKFGKLDFKKDKTDDNKEINLNDNNSNNG